MKIEERIAIITGDITSVDADAIVNAANEKLAGGGGVDGAVHKAAGPGLLAECRKAGGCPTGKAVMTGGYLLKAKNVIHTVGPVWRGGHRDEHALLASCYRESLMLASSAGIRTLAFPAISTGAYGFPVDQAALIALRETKRFLRSHKYPETVTFVLFSKSDFDTYMMTFEDEKTAEDDR